MRPTYITKNKDLITTVENLINEWHSSTEYIYINTSGSTGTPKSIKLKKKHMIASAEATGKFLQLKPGNTALLSMSPNTIGGTMMVIRSIVLGLNLVVTEVSSNPLADIGVHIDFAAMVPLQVKESLQKNKTELNELGTLIIGGGPINESLEQEILQLSPRVYHTYGMTETISHIALRSISNKDKFFKTLPHVQINSIESCLNITSEEIGVKDLQTNDIVEIIGSNRFIWLGRSDFAINSGGIKIIPSIVESILSRIIKENFISAGLNDETLGQKHVILVETNKDLNFSRDDFKVLENYKRPKEIYLLQSFVRTESGKVDRKKTIGLISNAKKQVL